MLQGLSKLIHTGQSW